MMRDNFGPYSERGARWLHPSFLWDGGDWETCNTPAEPDAELLCRTGRFARVGGTRGRAAEERIHELPEGLVERLGIEADLRKLAHALTKAPPRRDEPR